MPAVPCWTGTRLIGRASCTASSLAWFGLVACVAGAVLCSCGGYCVEMDRLAVRPSDNN